MVTVARDAPAVLELTRGFRKGTTFSVALYENASTGYLWDSPQQTGPQQTVAFLDTDVVPDPAALGMVGVGGTRYVRYQAQQPGSADLTFGYRRPWESESIRQVTLHVLVW